MNRYSWVAAVAALAFVTGCPKNEEPPKTEAPAQAAAPKTDEPKADDKAGQRKMEHCPSSVEGATTKVEATATAMQVTVTAAAEAATAEIRNRAKHLVEVSIKNPAQPHHNGEGEGGGALGQCPVVLADTTIATEDVPGGSKLTVTPTDAKNFPRLRELTLERQAKLVPPAGATAPGQPAAEAPPALKPDAPADKAH